MWWPSVCGPEKTADRLPAPLTLQRSIAAPPSQVPDGWVHWRVPPAACDFGVAAADLIFSAAATAVALRVDDDGHPGAQRPAGVVAVGMRS